jgi:hypothetical protein
LRHPVRPNPALAHPRVPPELARDLERVDPGRLPPYSFVAGAVRGAATPPCARSIGVGWSSAKYCDGACKSSRSGSVNCSSRQLKEKSRLKTTSEHKIRANRANARASTGPKTAQGRTRSARNALRHALSVPVYSDKALSEEVEALAREIAGADASAEMQELARRVAEAQIDVRRVRRARHHQLLSSSRAEWALRDAAPEAPITLCLPPHHQRL